MLTFSVSVSYSIKVNFACWVKLWPFLLKWTQSGIAFGWLTSSRVWYILKLFVWLLLNILVLFTCTQHKADLVVLQILFLPCSFSNFFLTTFQSFIKCSPMRSFIFLFLLNAVVGLLTNPLGFVECASFF